MKVTSADGTAIAYERYGDGPPVIVVGGATCHREIMRPLSERLARHFDVINYDRRGRAGSGDTPPYAVAREVEDLAALIAEAGGTAAVYGHSSGAGLALHAAAAGLPIDRLVLHEPPYNPDCEPERRVAQEYHANLRAALAEGRRGDAVTLFMTVVGTPPEEVDQLRQEPWWAGLEAVAPTLAYDSTVMGSDAGGTVPTDLAGRVAAATLVVTGGASPEWMIDTNRQVAAAVPHGRHLVLADQEHVVDPEILVPVLADFLARPS